MTPIKSNQFLNHPKRIHRANPVVDLRDYNMVHAAPIENDHVILTLGFDPSSGTLVPKESVTQH